MARRLLRGVWELEVLYCYMGWRTLVSFSLLLPLYALHTPLSIWLVDMQVVASSLDSLQPLILDDFRCKDDLCTSLRASANVPAFAGEPVLHRCALHASSFYPSNSWMFCMLGKVVRWVTE